MARKWSQVGAIHRVLVLDTRDHVRGEDARRFQSALGRRAKACGLGTITVDGIIGPATVALAEQVGLALGALPGTVRKTDKAGRRVLTVGLQRIVRFPGTRNPKQRARAKAWRPPAHAPFAWAPGGAARGIDVSNHQAHVDWSKVASSGIRFAWVKASEGTGFVDAYLRSNVKAAKTAGVKVGAYHFLRHGEPYAQAAHFVAQLRKAGLGPGDLLPVVDVEWASPNPTEADAKAFIERVTYLLGVRPVVYTAPGFIPRWASTHGCKLWVASYGVKQPKLPAPWTKYAAWQHSSTGRVPGVPGNCDLSSAPDLAELLWR